MRFSHNNYRSLFHEFTLAYNKLNKWLCVFGVLSEERAPSLVIVPEPGVLPWPGERGPSSPFSPDPEAPSFPMLGRKRAGSEELGWWRDAGTREIMEVRLLDYL